MKYLGIWRTWALVTLMSIVLNGCGDDESYVFTSAPAPLPVQTSGKLMAVYMVGSDLESRDGAGSEDLREMVDGLKSMTAAERDQLNLLIAFGGAKKDNWYGMKWMNAEQLLADAKDDVFGNETGAESYLYQDDSANMSAPDTLTRFLSYAATQAPAVEQRFVILWNHGGGYGGFGVDEVFGGILSLNQLDSAFDASSMPKVELLGFDACLMASLEVAKSIQEHGRFLVASEELEPGHGWNYRYVVPNFVRIASPEQYGAGLVDDFVDSRNHPYPSTGKTLSVLDLEQTDHVVAALNGYSLPYSQNLGMVASTTTGFVRAVSQSQVFGGRGDEKVSIDLVDFVEKSLFFGATNQEQSSALLGAIDRFVVHTADDDSVERAAGVSIVAPDKTGRQLEQQYFPGQGWLELTKASLELIARDVNPPELLSLEMTAEGLLASFADPLLTSVYAMYGWRSADGEFWPLEVNDASPLPGDDRWLAPLWDGQVYHLTYDASVAPLPIPMTFSRTTRTDNGEAGEIYTADIEFLDSSDRGAAFKPGTLTMLFRNGQLVAHQVETYIRTEDGKYVPDRNKDHLDIGDQIRFFSSSYRSGPQSADDTEPKQFGPDVVIAAAPSITKLPLVAPAGGAVSMAIGAEDFAENSTLSTLFDI